MPSHNLQLKVGSPISGCATVRGLVIQKWILNCKFRGENIFIPRIPIIRTDVSIQFKRVQFPIRLTFAITIKKSQGQTMPLCGLDLRTQCFSHGQ